MCENNYELCKKLNYNTAVNILNVCNDISAKMVFMSSSYVFSGDKGNYLETDLPNASNHYAISKIAAENEILKSKASIVIRSEPMYGFDEIRKELVIGTNSFEGYFEVGYSDLIRNPILIDDIPNVIYHLIKKNVSGIFNVAGTDNLKWLEFVSKLSKLINQEDKIRIVDPSDWMLKPPHDTSLDVTKINKIGITTTSFSKALEKLAKIL